MSEPMNRAEVHPVSVSSPQGSETAGSLGELLDRMVWDYSPQPVDRSPLATTASYFEDFPWDGLTEPDETDV